MIIKYRSAYAEGIIPDHSIGKNKSLSRRNGKHAKSLRQRANNRKAMRKA